MKKISVLFCAILTTSALYSQQTGYGSYEYKPAETPIYNPSGLLEKYSTNPEIINSTPTNSIIVTRPVQTEEKKITINNKGYTATEVEIYTKNSTTYSWEYYKTVRIPGGSTVSYPIGKYETYGTYGYMQVGSLNSTYKIITSFGSYPVNLY